MIKVGNYLALGALLASAPALAGEDYLRLQEAEVEWAGTAAAKAVSVEIKAAASVPMDGKSGAFGYALLSDSGNNVLVIVTHLPIDDSSYETVPSGFHTHVLDLKAPGPSCPGANFEVDLPGSKANARFDADYQWKVKGSEIEVEHIPAADLGDAGIESVASFKLKPVVGADGKPTNLCVSVIEQI